MRLRSDQLAFTLTELAVVLLIIGLLIGGAMLTLQAQNEAKEIGDTQRTLEQAREAISGFAIRNGRLPCPANANSVGAESFCTDGNAANACGALIFVPPQADPGHGRCSNPAGFVPAAALGIGPIQTAPPVGETPGRLVDAWQQPIRYVVAQNDAAAIAGPPAFPAVTRPFTSNGGLRQIVLRQPPFVPDLTVCLESTGLTVGPPADVGCAGGVPSFSTSAVLFSTGKNAIAGAPGFDDQENADGDRVFIAHEARPGYDDLVIWLSTNILFNRLIGAGAL